MQLSCEVVEEVSIHSDRKLSDESLNRGNYSSNRNFYSMP